LTFNPLLSAILAAGIMAPAYGITDQMQPDGAFALPDSVESVLKLRATGHPRLFLHSADLPLLREAVNDNRREMWGKIRAQADRVVREGPPAYQERDRWSGNEQLWQRGVGNNMPLLACAWLVTGDRKYLDAARALALASAGYPTWGLGEFDGADLAAGHQLLGLAVVYDWCGTALGPEARQTIRETLVRRASAMYQRAISRRIYWHSEFLQNHLWVNACGLAAAGLALYGEKEEAGEWIGFALDRFQRTKDALGPDGASHEGVGYWEYGVEYLLKFMWLARDLMGIDLYDHPWWRNTGLYPVYMSLPRASWTDDDSIVDIADCPRSHWYGPDYLLRALSRETRDGHPQWLADEIDRADLDSPAARWLNLLWDDPKVAPVSPADLPLLRHFSDLGLVSARSGWDGGESLVVFKCGPFIGHKAIDRFEQDPGGGHVHPDANHFVVFGCGEWLIRDDGYSEKWTLQHNTLLVDGRGQTGEGKMWFDGSEALGARARPRVLRAESGPVMDHIAGSASEAYPAGLGLKKFERHLLFIKPGILIVVDFVETDRPGTLALLFHPEATDIRKDGRVVTARGKTARLRLESLTPDAVRLTTGTVRIRRGEEKHGAETMPEVRLEKRGSRWRNATAFSWSAGAAEPARVTLAANGDTWAFTAGDRIVELDMRSGTARMR